MNLRHLEVFREVMRTNSITQSARNLGRTQPAISATIASLESSIGYELFERRNGRLHPVPEAHFLNSEAQKILEDMAGIERSMQTGGGTDSATLYIASMPVLAEFFMPHLIARFSESNASLAFRLVSQSSEQVYERVASQRYDIGLAEEKESSDLIQSTPFEANCLCAVPADDPLAQKDEISTADLNGRPAASFLPDHYIAKQLAATFAKNGHRYAPRFELQNAASQLIVVAEKQAYAVVSPLSAWVYSNMEPASRPVCFKPLQQQILYRFAIITPAHRSLSRVAQSFVSRLATELRGILDGGSLRPTA